MIIITIVFRIDFGSHLKTNFISMSIVFGIDFGSHVKPNLIILSIVFGIGFGSLFEAKKFVKTTMKIPDGTKSLQKSIQKSTQEMIIFLIIPRSIFKGFGGPN